MLQPMTKFSSTPASALSAPTRLRPLRRGSFALALTVLLLVGHGAAAQSGAGSTQGTTSNTQGMTSSMSTVSPLPSRAPLSQMTPPAVSEGRVGAAANTGPVTGYGAGGMSRAPGSPPNVPYRNGRQ
jgi:hypothetical protein